MHNYHSNKEIAEILRGLIDRNNNFPKINEIVGEVSGVSSKITEIIADIGISGMRDDIIIVSERSGNPFGVFPINVIPGEPEFACCSILVAVAIGLSGPCSFEKILNRCLRHLKECAGTTRVFLFYTDSWDEELFSRKFRKKFFRASQCRPDSLPVCSFFSVCTNPISGPRLVEYNTP